MGKGCKPRKGHSITKYGEGFDHIDWTPRKNKEGMMGSKTRVHKDKREKHKRKIQEKEIDDTL